MAINVVGTPAVASRSGTGSFTLTPPAGAASYLALIGVDHTQLTAPTGWTFVADYSIDNAGDKAALYKASSGAGSSWSTTAGTIVSDFPLTAIVYGFDTALPSSPDIRAYQNAVGTADAYAPGLGVTGGPGIQLQLTCGFSGTNGTLTYPPQYQSSRNTTKVTSTSAGLTFYIAGAARPHAETGFTGEAVWGFPGGTDWNAVTISINLPDPSATATPFAVPASGQWAGGTSATVTTSSTSTITGTAVTPDDSRLTYPGCKAVYNIGSGWYRPKELVDNDTVDTVPPYAVKFVTNSQTVEVNFRQRADKPTSAMGGVSIRLKVDGQWVTHRQIYLGNGNSGYPPAITTPTAYTASTAGWAKIDFGTAATRTVEVWLTTEFASIKVPTAQTITAAPLPGYSMLVLGDSLSANDQYGTGDYTSAGMSVTATYTSATGPMEYAAQTLGLEPVNSATGAGAYSIVGESQKWDDATVVARDVQAHDPKLIVIGTGLNDWALQDSPNSTTIGNAAADLFTKVKAACPNAVICVFGSPESTLTATSYAGLVSTTNTTLKAKATAAALPFFDPKAGVLYNGSGTAIYSPGTGWYHTSWEGPDQIHPSAQGSEDIGNAFASVFAQLLPASAAPAFTGSGTASATVVGVYARAAAFSGSGTLSAATVVQPGVAVTFTGSGALSATVSTTVPPAAAMFTGSGSLSATVGQVYPARSAAFSGDGSAVGATSQRVVLSAPYTGSGALTAGVAIPGAPPAVTATFSGDGSLSTTLSIPGALAADYSGEGTLSVTVAASAVEFVFTPPGTVQHWPTKDRLWSRVSYTDGVSLLRYAEDGLYHQVKSPRDEDVSAALEVYLGGRRYVVDQATAQRLVDAGYADFITQESVTV